MKNKIFICLYAEYNRFLIKRVDSLVIKIYAHYIFEQSTFKKDFVIMDQISGQKATSNVEKDFYKLMNNSNFGYDCRNNIDHCTFAPISDEFDEIFYFKNYQISFDEKMSQFVSCKLLQQEIQSKKS